MAQPEPIDPVTDAVLVYGKLFLGTVLPASVVAGSLLLALRKDKREPLGDIVAQDDIDEEIAHDKATRAACASHAAPGVSEATPLLHKPTTGPNRRARNLTYAGIGAFELITTVVLLIVGNTSVGLSRVFVWTYGTIMPLASQPAGPPYSLILIFLFALVESVVDIAILLLSGVEIIHSWTADLLGIAHVSAMLLGIVVCLDTRFQPRADEPELDDDGAPPALDDYATLGQFLTLSWLQPMLSQARLGVLEDKHLWQLAVDCKTRLRSRKFADFMPKANFLPRIIYSAWSNLALYTAVDILIGVLGCLQPILLRRILLSLEGHPTPDDALLRLSQRLGLLALVFSPDDVSQRDTRIAYLYSGIACALLLLHAQLSATNKVLARRITIQYRAAAIGTIYWKALVRIDTSGIVDKDAADASQEERADMGKLVSLVSVDVSHLRLIPIIIQYVMETPMNILITAIFLYSIMGYSGFVGYVLFIAVMPLQAWMTGKMLTQALGVAKQGDIRSRAVHELLQSIKFIKLSGWETKWASRIHELRSKELNALFQQQITQALVNLVWRIVPIFMACLSLTWYTVVAGHQLTVSVAFPAILALDQLTIELNALPTGFSLYAQLSAALKRIDEFLVEDEVPAWVSTKNGDSSLPRQTFDSRLGVADATFQWYKTSQTQANDVAQTKSPVAWYRRSPLSWFRKTKSEEISQDSSAPQTQDEQLTFRLLDINVIFPRGKMTVITGPTGSGKSSLLHALLGEMECVSGRVLLPKALNRVDPQTGLAEGVSFCAQHPWLESKSIKENILFGAPMDDERYQAVLSACVLNGDLRQMDHGDATEIGDKGIVLSGGQKARVALARAIYARTQTVLLDDVLSAVDTHTASALVRNCFFGPIMKGRTLVLVTHHFATVASRAAWIVKLENGSIVAQGDPDELRATGEFAEIAKEQQKHDAEAHDGVLDKSEVTTAEKKVDTLIEPEKKATGSVRWSVYAAYLRAASYWIVMLFVVTLFLKEAGSTAEKFWIKFWSESYDQPPGWEGTFGFPSASVSVMPYVLVYLGLQLATALLLIGGILPSIWSTIRASRTLFNRMLESVLRSPTRFFDRTPTGRILNRFSKDVGGIGGNIQYGMKRVGEVLISFILGAVVITYAIPPFATLLVFLLWLHLRIARGYVTASRDLTRITSTAASPMVTKFAETLHGLTTIRAFQGERRFTDAMFKSVDRLHAAAYYVSACDTWLAYRFDMLGNVMFGLSAFLAVYMRLDAGLAAIVLTQAQHVMSMLRSGLTVYVMVENSMNGVERIEEYIALPAEAPRHLAATPAAWPMFDAGVTFEDVVLRYAPELEPVLRGVSFHIQAGEKIGIVGRTGSGKSTLVMSLFRFTDPDSGRILLAGEDITKIGVQDLREQLTLIPQDAVLYKGTIRENLDPFKEHTDAACLDALRMVHLPIDNVEGVIPLEGGSGASSSNAPSGAGTPAQTVITLKSKVSEGGANWSAGQRQLIAMARALLRNTRIIVLDESTASVDHDTDRKIQATIREQFKGSTLLTIAHRLNTVIDYDRILVLDQGQVVEFDTPDALITRDGGVFRGMCIQSGHFDELVRAAKAKALIEL